MLNLKPVTAALTLDSGMFTASSLISAAIALVVCILVIWIVMSILRKVVNKSKIAGSLGNFVLKLSKIAMEFAAILIVAGSLGFDVTALLAVFSLLGLAISLSVQNLLANLVSGVVLLLTKPMTDGDYIQSGDAEGVVKDVGLFYTELTTLDNKIVSVPNSELSAAKIINYTKEPNRRVDLTFTASYDCDVETVKAALAEAVGTVPQVLNDPEVFIHVSSFGNSSIEYTVRAWCRHEDYWDVYFAVIEAVPAAFKAHGVQMTYDHLNVHVLEK